MPLPSDWEEKFLARKQAVLQEMDVLLKTEHLDEDGYPTESALKLIEIWWYEDPQGWLNFIQSIWTHAWWGWHQELANHEYRKNCMVIRYEISTAGWSGNESIIRAMEKNTWLWHNNWVQSRRGGHYIFEVEQNEPTN